MNRDDLSNQQQPFLPGSEGEPDLDGGVSLGEAPTDPLGAGRSSKIKSGSLLIVLVVLIALGGLFSLRTLSTLTAAQDGDSSAEVTINGFLAAIGGAGTENPRAARTYDVVGNEEPLRVLSDDYTERQVPLEDVAKNPFILAVVGGSETPRVGDATKQRETARQAWLGRAGVAAAALKLKSTMLGARPLANISGRIVQLNETIMLESGRGDGVMFTVVKIDADSVTVETRNEELDVEYRTLLTISRDM